MEDNKIHPMRVVARRTGLSSHVIRVWERRYQAVEPARTPTNRRLYSDADIERLRQLQRATHSGHSISQIARFSSEQLSTLIAGDIAQTAPTNDAPLTPLQSPSAHSQEPASYIDNALAAVRNMDTKALEAELFRAEIDMGRNKLLLQMVEPLMEQIGELWSRGDLRIADEHMATSTVRSFLGTLHNNTSASSNAPLVVITTPAGQWHEIGALLASLTATAAGWRTIYLGPNLPAEEIAAVAQHNGAQAVALSIAYPLDDPALGHELIKLRQALGDDIAIIAGGRAVQSYQPTLTRIKAVQLSALTELRQQLHALQ